MSDDWEDDDDGLPSEWARDAHALGRIAEESRAGMAAADLAMRLMRDRPLALAIAEEGSAGAERVALALGDNDTRPHLIVGRAGGYFATVLGPGMNPYPTPVVSFDRVQLHLDRAELLAQRTSRAHELWRDRAGVRHLLKRCDDAGPRLAREDFEEAMALAPILEPVYAERANNALRRVRLAAPHIVRRKRFPPSLEPNLRRFWNRFHAVGHYLQLSSVRGKQSFAFWDTAEIDAKLVKAEFHPIRHIYFPALILGQGYVALRVFAALGRAGELAVPHVKFHLSQMTSASQAGMWLLGAYALLAVARRHRKLRAELAHVVGLARIPPRMRQDEGFVGCAGVVKETMEAWWVEAGEDEDAHMRRLAEAVVQGIRGEESLALQGDALSFARLAARRCNFRNPSEDVGTLSLAVALCSEVPPQELYFPAASMTHAPDFSPEEAARYAQFVPAPSAPVRAEVKVGRNDPCSCGSGKKYKRCCGAGA